MKSLYIIGGTTFLTAYLVMFPVPIGPAELFEPVEFSINNSLSYNKAYANEYSGPPIKHVWVTAYSSTPEETDDTPFITASGKHVADGIIATNFLPFGTVVKIPELFDDKTFIVEDRMHRRKKNFVDVWMPTKQQAKEFGITYTQIVIFD